MAFIGFFFYKDSTALMTFDQKLKSPLKMKKRIFQLNLKVFERVNIINVFINGV